MFYVSFQNGADAPEILLDEKFETKEEAKSQLAALAQKYGTVYDAAAWLQGDSKPSALVKAEKQLAAILAAGEPEPAPAAPAAEPEPDAAPDK